MACGVVRALALVSVVPRQPSPYGQACIVIPVAALQYQHEVVGQVCIQASRPRIAAAVGASTVQVSALQAQPPVVAVAIPVHQTVGQALGILGRCTTLAEQGLPRHEGVEFLPVHGAAVRPCPAVGVGGGCVRSRGFGVRHSPVEFLNMPLGVGYETYKTPCMGVLGGFRRFCSPCSWGVLIFQPCKPGAHARPPASSAG